MESKKIKFDNARFVKSLQPILRHHPFIVTLVTLGLAIYAVFGMSSIMINNNDDPAYRAEREKAEVINGQFDETTVTYINQLRESSSGAPITLDDRTRANPFN